jgi:hypothetical protein
MTGKHVLTRICEHLKDVEDITYLHITIDKDCVGAISRCLFVGEPLRCNRYIPKEQWLAHVLAQDNIVQYWIYCEGKNFRAEHPANVRDGAPFTRYYD